MRGLDEIAERWRQLSRDRGAEHAALGLQSTLYLRRNRDARGASWMSGVDAVNTFRVSAGH